MAHSSFSGKTLIAVGACFVAAFSLSAMDSTMKALMAQGIDPLFAQGVRGWMIVLGIFVMMTIQRGPADFRLIRPRAWIVWLRGVSMFMSSVLIFIAISKIEQATVTSMIFLYPLLVGLLGAVFLGEAIGPRRVVFILLGQ